MNAARPATVDLIVATIGRTSELDRLFSSIDAQTHRNVRLLVVDQNDDERLEPVFAAHARLPIVRLRSRPGLSRARNVALAYVTADVVAFPDDDCWYPHDLVERVVEFLTANADWDGVSVRSTDAAGKPSNMRWDGEPGPIDRFNVWRRAISYGVFLRRPVVQAVGRFDETLGVGAGTPWGSGEETDYVLRALRDGRTLHYEPSLHVFHASPDPPFTRAAWVKAYRSGLGNARVLRTHGYPHWFAAQRVLQLLAASLVFLGTARPARAAFYVAMAAGRARGWAGFRATK